VGLVALPFLAVIAWLTVSGWRDFYWLGRGRSRSALHFLWFLPLAALISGAAYCLTVILISGLTMSLYSYALYVAVVYVVLLWTSSVLASALRERRSTFSNACRVATAFIFFSGAALDAPLKHALNINLTPV